MGKHFKNKGCKSSNKRPYLKGGWKAKPHGGQEQNWERSNLREDQVGITEYISSAPGFTGVVKSRFSDFHVNEIDRNGKVLELNDLTIPQLLEDKLTAEELVSARKQLDSVITAEIWEKITALAGSCGAEANEPIQIDVEDMCKEKRTQIHKVLKKMFAGKLVSTTVNSVKENADESLEKKFIKIMKPKGGRDNNRMHWSFPGEFVHFLIYKENMDTSEVASSLADRLNLRPSQVNYCGTKDKRAKTTQKFCVKHRTPSRIVSSIKGLHQVHVGNFEFSNETLKLGDLKGNRFRIVLRHLSADDAQIESALQTIRERGFINYFGLQRFGNCSSIPTYEVGVALIKSDFKLACELILKPRGGDPPFLHAIREAWWSDRDSKAASDKLRSDKFIEKKLFDGLVEFGENDYSAALRKIPRNMLLLYPHSFQSLIFNQIASRRIKELGFQLIPGDLVYRNKAEIDIDTVEIPVDDTDVIEIGNERINCQDQTESAATTTESIFKRKVKALTAEDIASGAYTLFDVVLSLPGYDVTYPNNVVGDWYEQALQLHGLSSEKLRHNVKTFAMAGAYRKLLIQPTDMSWQFCTYDNTDSTLIISDWEKLKAKPNTINAIKSEHKGKFKALILDFCLPTAAYATMMLRELLKSDTSAANQTELEKTEIKKAFKKDIGQESDNADMKPSPAEEVSPNGNEKSYLLKVDPDGEERTSTKRKAETDQKAVDFKTDSCAYDTGTINNGSASAVKTEPEEHSVKKIKQEPSTLVE